MPLKWRTSTQRRIDNSLLLQPPPSHSWGEVTSADSTAGYARVLKILSSDMLPTGNGSRSFMRAHWCTPASKASHPCVVRAAGHPRRQLRVPWPL